MALRTIPQIKVGAFPQGTCFNAYIYNCNVNIGVSGEPTTITLNLVNEDGIYNINKGNLSAIQPYLISVGTMVFQSMYLTAFSYSQNVGERTIELTFTDASIILDKIQVLLLNKEASPWNMGAYRGTWNVGANRIIRTYNIPIVCGSSCERTGFPAFNSAGLAQNPWWNGELTSDGFSPYKLFPGELPGNNRSGKSVPWDFFADKAMVTNANMIYGGSIIIGEEQFTTSPCAVPDVKYTFDELLAVMSLIGLKVEGLHNRGRPHLSERFTGSLRKVLSEWCNLYGFSYVWDFGTNIIKAIDLHAPQTNMDAIHTILNNLGDDGSGVAITDIKRTADLKGTYNQDSISTFVKPASQKSNERTFHQRTGWIPLTINNFIPWVENSAQWYLTTGGRTKEELITSAILAKYSPAARTLYNYYLMATKTNDFQNGSSIYGKILGLNIKAKLTDDQKADLVTYTMSLKEKMKVQDKYGENGACYIGTYSKELEDKWIAWEKEIANSIGKYYYLTKPAEDTFFCSGFEHIVKELTTKPQAELYNKDNTSNLPFEKLLKHPGGGVLPAIDPMSGRSLDRGCYIHSRNNAYGIKDEDLDLLWYDNEGQDLLKEYLPSHQVLEAQGRILMDDLIKNLFPNIYPKLEQIEDEKKVPNIFFFPVRAKVLEVFEVTDIKGTSGLDWILNSAPALQQAAMFTPATGNVLNKYEFQTPTDTKQEKKCSLWCDGDMVQLACECPEGDSYNPDFVGLTCVYSRYLKVRVAGSPVGIATIPLPSEYPFAGYWSLRSAYRRVQSAIYQHFGGLTNAGLGMEYRVNINDITPDLDSMEDQTLIGGPVEPGQESGQIPSFIPVPGLTTLQKASNYHQMTHAKSSSFGAKETLSFTMAGLNFSVLGNYMQVEQGLSSLSISLTENGVQANIGFSSKEYPEVSEAMKFQRIGPRMNSNAFLRTF
tara:strand:+ start:4233 stop:7055 length:2823 start_codon:yes stop_codon:yes gene_type:complete